MRCPIHFVARGGRHCHRVHRLSAALVAVVAALCLQACGGGGDDEGDAAPSVSIPTPPRVPAQQSY